MEIKTKNTLSKRTFWPRLIFPATFTFLIVIIKFFPYAIEHIYSTNIYMGISLVFRKITGLVKFSIGDLFYVLVILRVLVWIIAAIVQLKRNGFSRTAFGLNCLKLVRILLWIFIWFNILWGLNYNRLGIAYQMKLKPDEYTTEELKDLTCDLLETLNATRIQLGDSTYQYPVDSTVFKMADTAYFRLSRYYSFLEYNNHSVKPSLLTQAVSYAGYSGYYNPFSGEAQVNTDLPKFLIPYVTCHEIGHQLGYASESEASFAGYLAAIHSKNILFQYSACFDLYLTANSELFRRDFWAARANMKSLNPLVKRDIRIYREYIFGKQNNIEPVMKVLYDRYLKANQQNSGIDSYDEVLELVIAYKKKLEEKAGKDTRN